MKLLFGLPQFTLAAHEPDTAAGGPDRRLDDAGKPNGSAHFIRGFYDACFRLRQFQFMQQAAEAGLAVRDAIVFKRWQRKADASFEALLYARKKVSLFMDRQQHVEALLRQQSIDERQIPGWIVAQPGAAMKLFYKF